MKDKKNIQTRNYCGEPIVIGDNFTSLAFGITFWLMFNGLVIYLVFFGNAIDWSQNKDWIEILKNEISMSHRFSGVIIGFIVSNLLAIYSFYKNLKNPRKIILTNEYIKKDKSFNDLEYLELKDISEIKKSFFPLLGTGFKTDRIGSAIGLLSFVPFVLTSGIILYLLSILLYRNFTFICFIVIFSKKDNRVINIPIYKIAENKKIKKYFLDTLDIDIDKVQTNFKLSNTQGDTDVR